MAQGEFHHTTNSASMSNPVGDIVQHTRQSHAMEHATIHILSRRQPGTPLMGRSTPQGFYIYGNVPSSVVASAAAEALSRLQAGEAHLAVHPRCGSNLAVGALLGSIASTLVLGRRRRSLWEEIPAVFLALSGAWLLAQPAGLLFQKHVTTTPDVKNVRIASIEGHANSRQMTHRVILERD